VEASNWGGYGDGPYVLLAAPAVQPQTNFFLLFVLALSAFPVVSPLIRSFALLLQLLQHGSLFSLLMTGCDGLVVFGTWELRGGKSSLLIVNVDSRQLVFDWWCRDTAVPPPAQASPEPCG
jgi:hypothetical protein